MFPSAHSRWGQGFRDEPKLPGADLFKGRPSNPIWLLSGFAFHNRTYNLYGSPTRYHHRPTCEVGDNVGWPGRATATYDQYHGVLGRVAMEPNRTTR